VDPEDANLLEEYQKNMAALSKHCGPLVSAMQEQLRQAGFNVIPTPACFLRDEVNINLFNAITGTSKKSGEPLILLFGVEEGKRLGAALMDEYFKWISAQIPGVKVFFMGADSSNRTFYGETRSWAQECTGAHCLSFET
jgi:hypothetical protein